MYSYIYIFNNILKDMEDIMKCFSEYANSSLVQFVIQ